MLDRSRREFGRGCGVGRHSSCPEGYARARQNRRCGNLHRFTVGRTPRNCEGDRTRDRTGAGLRDAVQSGPQLVGATQPVRAAGWMCSPARRIENVPFCSRTTSATSAGSRTPADRRALHRNVVIEVVPVHLSPGPGSPARRSPRARSPLPGPGSTMPLGPRFTVTFGCRRQARDVSTGSVTGSLPTSSVLGRDECCASALAGLPLAGRVNPRLREPLCEPARSCRRPGPLKRPSGSRCGSLIPGLGQ